VVGHIQSRTRSEVKVALRILVVGGLLMLAAHRLPAPISEVPEKTPAPKLKSESVRKPIAIPAFSFAGTWRGSTTYNGHGHVKSFVWQIKVSNDEKTVWLYVSKAGKQDPTDSLGQWPCSRFGETLTWSFKDRNVTATDTLRINANGTANFVVDGTWNLDHAHIQWNGTLSRQ
jgi:hypothetical protein